MIRIDNVMIEDYDLRIQSNDHIKLSTNLCKTVGISVGENVAITADENGNFYIGKHPEGRKVTKQRTIISKSAAKFLSDVSDKFDLSGESIDFEGSTYYTLTAQVEKQEPSQADMPVFEERSVL